MKRLDLPRHAVPKRRMLRINLPTRERMLFDAIGRAYGIVSENGAVRTPELCRVLLVVCVSPEAQARVSAAIAARINAKMIVARVGKLLAMPFGATSADSDGNLDPHRNLHVTLDGSLMEQVLRFIPNTNDAFDGHGHIVACRVIRDMICRALADPRLPAVMAAYAPWINAFLARISKMEGDIRAMLAELAPAMEGVAA